MCSLSTRHVSIVPTCTYGTHVCNRPASICAWSPLVSRGQIALLHCSGHARKIRGLRNSALCQSHLRRNTTRTVVVGRIVVPCLAAVLPLSTTVTTGANRSS